MRSEDELGRGAFGAVYRMRHRKKGTVMAVKVGCHTSSDSGRGRDGVGEGGREGGGRGRREGERKGMRSGRGRVRGKEGKSF